MSTESIPNDSVALLVPFQISPGNGGVGVVVGQSAILRQQLIGVLMTNHYEHPMNPAFGADIQTKLFDPVDELVAVDSANMIRESLSSISALLQIGKVEFSQDPQEASGVVLTVQYSVANQAQLLQLRFVDGILTEDDSVA